MAHRRRLAPMLGAVLGLLLAGLGGGLAGRFVEDRVFRDLAEAGQHRLDLYALNLRAAIARYDALPYALAHGGDMRALLVAPTAPAIAQVNQELERLADEVSVAALYVMDYTGLTLAASNWQTPGSFVGQSYAFRPYFTDAMQAGRGRYYGVGITTGQPGYFLAARVNDASGAALGVVAAKVELEDIARDWQKSGDTVLLTDGYGVIFLSSRADWTYRALITLDPGARAALSRSQQYAQYPIGPPPLIHVSGSGPLARETASGPLLLRQSVDLSDHGWTLHLVTDLNAPRTAAWTAGLLVSASIIILTLLALYADQSTAARRALVLAETNRRLQQEIAERTRTEADLRAAQDDLVQASKLAALGQMSAALAHEINQPLAALQTFLASSRLLLERGEEAKVQGNIDRMEKLIARISGLTQHLKRFARKSPPQRTPLPLLGAVRNAVALFENRLTLEGIDLSIAVPESLTVLGDDVRLEQVLVNLIGNALDAIASEPLRCIRITATDDGGSIHLSIGDSGPGFAPEALPRLFTPFFTTKPPGQGLGLGLVVSKGIVEDMGGTLTLENRPDGETGARFILSLPSAEEPSHG
jgi:two-component system C4-dicarboxylate transport sensor histidine kinase DctB